MRFRSALLTLAMCSVAACSVGPDERKARPYAEHQLCPQERSQVCTREYAPVCALLENGHNKEYANACGACADSAVVGYKPVPCP